MHMKPSQEPCANPECGYIATERNRYFTGKYMTARDFLGEQEYFLSRDRLHNRLLHGWGIVCGLDVRPHRDPDCADRWVIVTSGIAIDCCGREIVLEKQTAFKVWEPPKQEQKGGPSPTVQAAPESSAPDLGPFLLCVRYAEEEIEVVPALYADGQCDPNRREANRVREVARLEVHHLHEVDSDCWRVPEGGRHAHCRDDCDDQVPGPAGTCLEPACPCGDLVPLALITPRAVKDGYVIKKHDIDKRGRRHLPTPPDYLTHIVYINWPHGREVSLSHLRNDMHGRLEVRFDRKLLAAEGDATGINGHTFVVQYGGIQQDIEFLPFDGDHPPTVEDECRAVFAIDPDYLGRKGRDNIANNVVYVTLKCDFILDCHENPIDGDHLRGRLPSGDGVPGGVFESWFRVVSDRDVDKEGS